MKGIPVPFVAATGAHRAPAGAENGKSPCSADPQAALTENSLGPGKKHSDVRPTSLPHAPGSPRPSARRNRTQDRSALA